jgi:hypothetical protein
MLSAGQLRGHGAKGGFFSRAHEGAGFPSFEALDQGHPATMSVAKHLKLDESAPRGVGHGLGPADDVHFGEDCFHVRLHGAFTNKEG